MYKKLLVLFISVLMLAIIPLNGVAADSDGYWQLSDIRIDSKNFERTSAPQDSIYKITYGGPENGFDAVFTIETAEKFGNGKYTGGARWKQLPNLLIPKQNYRLNVELTEIEKNTRLVIGGTLWMQHGIVSVPPPPGKSGGAIEDLTARIMATEGKSYSTDSKEFVCFPKQSDIKDEYIIRINMTADSTKGHYHYDYVYKWVPQKPPELGDIIIMLNNARLVTDMAPVNINGRIMLPVRSVSEALGAEIHWDSSTRTVTAAKQGKDIKLQIDSTAAIVNGETKFLDVPASIINGKTFVPVRFISESFGAEVAWNPKDRIVLITVKK